MAQPFHKILVPTDFSADAEEAIRVASDLSSLYVAPLTLVHVYDPVSYPLPDGYMMYTPGQLSDVLAELEQRLQKATSDARHAGAQAPQSRLLNGFTANEIVDFARDEGCDLIVMGTHGRRGFGRFLLGSVAERVVQTAQCPVLTVKRSVAAAASEAHKPAA